MKKEELTIAINVLVDVYDRNANRIDPDKCLAFHVEESYLHFFVSFAWTEEMKGRKDSDPRLDNQKAYFADDNFTILKSELKDFAKLESYVNDVCNKVSERGLAS